MAYIDTLTDLTDASFASVSTWQEVATFDVTTDDQAVAGYNERGEFVAFRNVWNAATSRWEATLLVGASGDDQWEAIDHPRVFVVEPVGSAKEAWKAVWEIANTV